MIDTDFIVRTACDLVRIPSVNPAFSGQGEAAVADYVQGVLTGIGLEVTRLEETPGRPSIVGVLRGGRGPSLMLNAHYDTVGIAGMADPFSGALAGGRIHGRGAFDMKGALASCIGAVAALREAGITPPGDVMVAAVADEENASAGTSEVLRHVRPDRAIVTEPTGLNICLAHKGFVWAEYESAGRAAHGSRPDLGIDANLGILPVLNALDEYRTGLAARAPHPLVGVPSVHVGMLRGGVGLSTYAATATVGVERRTVPGESLQDVRDELESLVPPGANIAFRHLLSREAFETSPDAPLVRATAAAYRAEQGTAPSFVGEGPWMDSALLAEAGAETVVLGPSGAGAHADEEYVEVDSLIALTRILAHVAAHA